MTRLQRATALANEGDVATWVPINYNPAAVWGWTSLEFEWDAHECYQVAASLALDGYPARGTCRLAVTNLYPGNTFKGWGRI